MTNSPQSLEREVNESVRELNRRRSAKRVMIVVGLAAALSVLVGASALMYSTNTGTSEPERIGEEVFE